MQWGITSGVVLLILAAIWTFGFWSRAGIIARATAKEAVRQPVFLLLLALSMIILIVNVFVPFFSLGEDIKMLKDCGLATLLISGILLAVWTASTSIASEIEGKTAMTLLSKPINRRQFVVGKYVGILRAVLALLLPLAIVLLLCVFYKVGYDAKESSREAPPIWDSEMMLPNMERMAEVGQVVPGVLLIFLEIAVLTAVSVAISTRLPMVVNMVSCLTIFVIGHLTEVLVKSAFQGLEFVSFMARLIATVLPSLGAFDIKAAVATGTVVPPVYLGTALVYSVVYCAAAILLAFILFEDRDLA